MTLEKCELCGHDVSDSALTCPGCNDVRRQDLSSQASVGIAMCAFVLSAASLLPHASEHLPFVGLLVLGTFAFAVIGFGPQATPRKVKRRRPPRRDH